MTGTGTLAAGAHKNGNEHVPGAREAAGEVIDVRRGVFGANGGGDTSGYWHERETYDFFGIVFDGHPAQTRIMMPDDRQGIPQRKDYPLGGIPVAYKGAQIPAPDQRRSYS